MKPPEIAVRQLNQLKSENKINNISATTVKSFIRKNKNNNNKCVNTNLYESPFFTPPSDFHVMLNLWSNLMDTKKDTKRKLTNIGNLLSK